MKKENEENKPKKFKKKEIKIKLIKNFEPKDKNSKIFGNTFTSSFYSTNKQGNDLLNQKMNKIKKPNKFNLTNQSNYINSTNNKTNISTSIHTYRNKLNKNNDNKMTSSFYITKEVTNKGNKGNVKEIKKIILNLPLNEKIKQRNKNKDILGDNLTFRNNININKDKELNKTFLSKRKMLKESENIINKIEKKNIVKKDNNKVNKVNNKEVSRINKFERINTQAQLKPKKNEDNKVPRGKSVIKKDQNNQEKKPYNNLYDKYVDKLKEKIQKIALNKNYKTDEDLKKNTKIRQNKTVEKKELKKYKTQTNFFKKNKIEKKEKEKEKNYLLELPKKQGTKIKIEKRKVGKSVGVKRDKEKNVEKEKDKKNKKEDKQQNNNVIKLQKRSKSMAKLTDLTKKNLNDEKYDIEYILYGKLKPSKYEDPFDDVDSIVKYLDLSKIRLNTKNIFSVEGNEKYENYRKNFDVLFNKAISNNKQRNSIEKDNNKENNENQINILQSENTTDSFKKTKINISFIENNG